MAQTLSSIASRQAKATTQLKEEVNQFLDSWATHPDAIVGYKASDMILALHSDASHLSEPLSKSRATGQRKKRQGRERREWDGREVA